MGLVEALFGDDSSVEKAFELNLQNIAAGVNALNQAGIDSLPLLEKMNMVIRTRFDQMDKTIKRRWLCKRRWVNQQLGRLPAVHTALLLQPSSKHRLQVKQPDRQHRRDSK